ncbi:MAG: hypothetical protein Q8Q01_01695 [archaeon]|nr:hypothetical protein [archaeon]
MGKYINELSDLFVLSCFAGSLYFLDTVFKNDKYGFQPEHFDNRQFLTQQGLDYISSIRDSWIESDDICQLLQSCIKELNLTIGKRK